jgi:hypothetical protein
VTAEADLAGLKSVYSQLTRSRAAVAQMIKAAEGAPRPEPILDAARDELDAVQVPPGGTAGTWQHDAAAPQHTCRRWIYIKEAMVVDGVRVVASVAVAGVQSAHLVQVDAGWHVDGTELGHWAIQVDVEHVLDSGRAHELAAAISAAADFLARLEPVLTPSGDELAARRVRNGNGSSR